MAANAVILAVTVLFSGFILLDAFVIPHYYGEVEITEPNQTDTRSPETSSAGPDITEPAATDAVSSRVPENTGAPSPVNRYRFPSPETVSRYSSSFIGASGISRSPITATAISPSKFSNTVNTTPTYTSRISGCPRSII